jgi:hypothetical protein
MKPRIKIEMIKLISCGLIGKSYLHSLSAPLNYICLSWLEGIERMHLLRKMPKIKPSSQ